MDEGIITKDEIDALSSKFSTTEIGQSVDSQTDAPKLVEIATNTENHDSKNTSTIETSTNTEADNVITTSIETQTEKVSSSSIDTQIGFGSLSTSTLMSDSLPLSSLPLEIQQPMILDSPGLSIDFVNDITIPDGTRMAPGEAYTKVWRLQNTGSMQLPSNAKLVFLSGDKMSGPMTTDLPDAEAGQQFDITMDLVAPNEEGEYEGCWNITLVDSDSNDLSNIPPQITLWVKIVVTQEVSDDSSWSVIEEVDDSDESESEANESESETNESESEEENIKESENEDNQQSNDSKTEENEGNNLEVSYSSSPMYNGEEEPVDNSEQFSSMIMPLPSSMENTFDQNLPRTTNAVEDFVDSRYERYSQELQELADMGFEDFERCISVLEENFDTTNQQPLDLNEIANILLEN